MANVRRDLVKERRWRGVLRRRLASGLSVRAFCRREGLCEPSFYAWRRTIGERDARAQSRTGGGRRAPRPAFLPVVVRRDGDGDGAIVIELAGGRVLRLSESTSAERLAELVHALETRGAS